ncbi:MAG: EthD domain-containing protein [Novosphingobium sp.]|nr:EthD domain-containing protein [Novosphingobium sp.]
MEKIIYALWAPEGESRESFNARILSTLPEALAKTGATGIRLNLRDEAVAPAGLLIQQWQDPQQDAVLQLWLPSSNAMFREPTDAVIAAHCGRFAAWLVAESTIIPNTGHPPVPGQRTYGWSQASFISFLPDMSWDEAIAHWHRHHTRVAIDTQSNFEYVQNLIVKPLTEDAPGYGAFVEECFPPEAMADPYAFFDAVGDEEKFKANTTAMTDSCAAFIDFRKIDIIPTSQYDFAKQN